MSYSELFREFSRLKPLIKSFAESDFKARYKTSTLGFIWAIIEPLFVLSILYVVFTNIMKFEVENYQLYLLLGIINWNLFSRGTNMGLGSIINRGHIIKNVYFSRIILPFSTTITAFMFAGIEFAIFGVFLAVFGFLPGYTVIYLIPLMFLMFILILGLSFLFSVLYVRFRDLQYIWSIVIMAGFFVSPIIYQVEMFPENLQKIILISPVAQIMNMSYDVTLKNSIPTVENILYTVLVVAAIFIIGIIVFRNQQKRIVERI